MQDLKLMELNLIEKLSGERIENDHHTFEFQAAIGYVISIRSNKEARSRSFGLHREAFEEYMWDTSVEDLNEAAKEAGFSNDDEDPEVKKD
ncbi:hypothetical protein QM797_10130 [Rhodococcus sp. IEGM 1381]|uniref:hypothetical protein n=1 Tax=Rhodococcus sp. IEGM 1381 TaxID=3047085 RepID=UPI0024B6F9D3|nr:hypothetical protein [Rhodococcus sp. IEGM 1381]MDI9895083.1 hypothetical protein [Rhodococcus sp. IEGM 1381]